MTLTPERLAEIREHLAIPDYIERVMWLTDDADDLLADHDRLEAEVERLKEELQQEWEDEGKAAEYLRRLAPEAFKPIPEGAALNISVPKIERLTTLEEAP